MEIKFTAVTPHMWQVALKPVPASQYIPDWWRQMTPYDKSNRNPDGKKLIVENFDSNATFKKCTPMLDGITSGYIIPLWSDVQITKIQGNPRVRNKITWRVSQDVFQRHGDSAQVIQPPTGYREVFKFCNPWIPRTPKGYSILVTQPLGYRDTPFHVVPAVVDSDSSTLETIFPVWVKDDFEGVVEKGIPMVQLIPFKRESWTSTFDYMAEGEVLASQDRHFNSTIVNNYIKNHWSKKTYK